ncbi:MAG: hypothetical protein GX297_00470 [Treponema sp.]|nr:hypothetical protein [Treponema sp.]
MGKNTKKTKEGFFAKLFESLFVSLDPEAEKKRSLRLLAKQIGKSKYKFYKCQQNQAQPAMAKWFYELYKVVSPVQALLSTPQTVNVLKNCIIDYSLSNKQKEIADRLTDESITQRATTITIKELAKQVKSDLSELVADFDQSRMAAIDGLYSLFSSFSSFVTFDYFLLIKKFDSSFRERDFSYTPSFQPIKGNHIVDDLKDFMAVAWSLRSKANWPAMFKFVREYKSNEVFSSSLWNKVLSRVTDVRNSEIFDQMIAYITENPNYKYQSKDKTDKIVDTYIEQARNRIENLLKKLTTEKANSKTDELLQALFGKKEVVILKNYTEEFQALNSKRITIRFVYCKPINYMKAFLIDYFKKDVREVYDLVVMRGKWVDQDRSKQLSNAYNELLDFSNRITDLDDFVGNMVSSARHKTILPSGRDINQEAHYILTKGAQDLVFFAKYLKLLIEDCTKTNAEILINWKEVEHVADSQTRNMMIAAYKKIFLFVSLMQIFITEGKSV